MNTLPIDPNAKGAATEIRFFHKEVEDKHGSIDAGRTVFKTEEWIEFSTPGSSGRMQVTPMRVRDEHRKLYAQAYNAWKNNEEPPVDGTTLNEFPMINQGMRDSFKRAGIKTIEALSVADENVLRHVGPGARDAQNKARAWLDASKNTGTVVAKSVANEARLAAQDKMIEKLQKQVVELNELLTKRGGGKKTRPTINEDEDDFAGASA